MAFDPKAYLASKGVTNEPSSGGFNPSAYLESKGIQPEAPDPYRGGYDTPVSPDQAKIIAGNRVLGRALAASGGDPVNFDVSPTGEIVPNAGLGSDIRSFIEGAGKSASFGTSDALTKLILGSNFQDQNVQPRNLSPKLFELGQFAGNFMNPFAGAGKAIAAVGETAPSLGQLMAQGIKQGAAIGGTSGASNVIAEKGLNATPTELATGTALGTVVGGGVGGVLPPVFALPSALKASSTKLYNMLNEKIAGLIKGVENATGKDQTAKDQLAYELQNTINQRDKIGQSVVNEAEQSNAAQLQAQQDLFNAQQQNEAAGATAIGTQQANEPQISAAQARYNENAGYPILLNQELPTPLQPSEFGAGVTGAISEGNSVQDKAIKEAYGAVKKSIPKKQPAFEAPAAFKAAKDSKQDLSKGFNAGNNNVIQSWLNETSKITETPIEAAAANVNPIVKAAYEGGTPAQKAEILKQYPELVQPSGQQFKKEKPKYTWDELQRRFQQVNEGISQAVKHGDNNDVRILMGLKQGLVSDMDSYAAKIGSGTSELFKNANALFAEREQSFNNPRITPLTTDIMSARPNELPSKIVTGNNAPTINNLKQILPPAQFAQVQAQHAQQLFSPTSDVPFDPSHFVKQYEKFNAETLNAVFGPERTKQLGELYTASKGLDSIKGLQSSIDEANQIAQKAQTDFQKAQTTASENSILAQAKTKTQQKLDDINAEISDLQAGKYSPNVQARLEKLQSDIEDAQKALDKARNPAQIPNLAKYGLAVTALAGGVMTGHPVLGALGLTGSMLGTSQIGRQIGKDAVMEALRRGSNANVGDASAQFAERFLTQGLTTEAPMKAEDQLNTNIRRSNKAARSK